MGCSNMSVLGLRPISDLPQNVKRIWASRFFWILCRNERCGVHHDLLPRAR
jgi:hypothetical protein